MLARLVALAGLVLAIAPGAVQAQETYAAAMKAGRGAYGQSDMATAQRHFEDALKTAENERQKASAHYALGVVSQKQNKLAEAKQHAERALAINPADKQAKGLLDEVNAPPAAAAKKGGPKGLAKTPLAPGSPGTKAMTMPKGAVAAPPVAKAAKPAAKAVAAPNAGPATTTPAVATPPVPQTKVVKVPLAKVPVAKAPAAKTPATTAPVSTGAASPSADAPPVTKKSPARLPSATQSPAADPDVQPRGPQPPGRSGALPDGSPSVAPGAAPVTLVSEAPPVAVRLDVRTGDERTAELRPEVSGATTQEGQAEPSTQRTTQPATAIVTGSIAGSPPAAASVATAAVAPVSATALLTNPAPEAAPPPARGRFVEMTCGLDHRREGHTFARAFEITRGPSGGVTGEIGEIVTFDLACEKAADGRPAPRALMKTAQSDIIRSPLRTAPEGGWSYWHHRSQRLVRLRLEGDDLVVVPSAAEVAVLRRKLAENPAQLEAMAPEIRRKFELVVTGEGYPEFRRLRQTDQLDAVFDAAAKAARRGEQTSSDAQAGASGRP